MHLPRNILHPIGLLLAIPVGAEQESITADSWNQLEESVISATRLGSDAFTSPYSIQTLSAEELEQLMARNLTESLESTPGVMVQKTANGQGSLYLRGFTGYRTLALIDGVRYNNSVYRDGPNEYFSLIDSQSLSAIELLQGPSSVLYGSDAIGGALNLKTKASDYQQREGDYLSGSQWYRYSSAEDSHITRSEIDLGQGERWGLRLGLSWKQLGEVDAADIGAQRKTGYDELAWDSRFDLHINDCWNFTYVHQSLGQDDVWRTHSTIYGVSFAGSSIGTDLRRVKDQERTLDYIQFKGSDINRWIDRASLTCSYQTWNEDSDRQKANKESIDEFFDSRMWGLDIQLESETSLGRWIYGVDFYRDQVDSGRKDFLADGSLDSIRIQGPVGDDATYDMFGSYVQGEFQTSDRLQCLAGVRYNYVRAKIGAYEDPLTGKAADYDDHWDTLVGSLRAIYDLDPEAHWKAWGGISQSFRAPNIADISRYGKSRSDEIEVAATDLDPEHFTTLEIGIKSQTDTSTCSVSYYYTDMRDYITSTPTGNIREGLREVSKQNSSSGHVQGLEVAGRFQLSPDWTLWGNFTWLEGELDAYQANGQSLTEPLSRVMPMTLNAGVRWDHPNRKLWAEISCTIADDADRLSSADQQDTERIPPGGTPGYQLVHLRGGYRFNESFEMTAGLENIFDEAYRVHGSGSNEPGFGLTLALKAQF
ncbi:TonB-dependent receptor [Verrucomicrobiaceae bacterium N1E253]|uniref:TonB-dependent receptor n=1 Tax=Oceaniferula marina TaxID=2748318 RepID=A0A851GKT2_9BACT|nr:TonB-dependent receptor [Oceaniferula marina]NWK54774.1 TonB-dependent receptor [Oceaniferula marina]